MSEEKRALHFVSLKFDNSKPPEFQVKKDLEWVNFGTEAPYFNRYPDYCLNLFERANKHSAFIQAKAYFISGNGVTIDKTGLTVGDSSLMINELKEVNVFGETIGDILQKVTLDFEIHNGAYLEINWWKNRVGFDIAHIPFHSLRISPDEKKYFYSNDWKKSKSDQTKEKTEFREIPIYDPGNRVGKQIYALKGYTPGAKYYPKPNYLGVIPSAESEYEIANYHLKSIKSGFHIGTIISFIGRPTPEEQDEIERQLKEKFQGTDQAGSLLLQFTRDKDSKPEVTRLAPDELDKKFETLSKSIEQELTAGHHMMPILAGIKTEGQLGGRSEIDVAYEVFDKTYVRHRQNIIEKWINKLYEKYGFQGRIKFKKVSPISPFDYKDIFDRMDENEIREMAGLPPRKKPTQNTPQKMNADLPISESSILDEFEKAGEADEDFTILEDLGEAHMVFTKFAKEPSDFDKSVLSILSKDTLITNDKIAELLKVKPAQVEKSISSLEENGYLTTKEKNQQGVEVRKVRVTETGKELASESKIAEKKVMYKYDWRPEIPDSERNTNSHPSRQFCKKMMELSKSRFFSRAEIDSISSRVGINVWTFRGGWWNDNGVNSPSCRHIWKSYLVEKK